MQDEMFNIYCVMQDGTYDKPDIRVGALPALEYARRCAAVFPEVLITDTNDCCVFHCKNGEILFSTKEGLRSAGYE